MMYAIQSLDSKSPQNYASVDAKSQNSIAKKISCITASLAQGFEF